MLRSAKFSRLVVAATFTMTAACGVQPRGSAVDVAHVTEAWNANNDPANLKGDYEVALAALPTSGELSVKPWTDTYWPSYRGGLAGRWNDRTSSDAYTYELHGSAAVAAMSRDDLARLSPAEKYDIFTGRYSYPLVMHERQRTHADDPSWFGLCHGWAPAAFNFAEPRPVVVRGAAGIEVPFGSSDVKALLTFAQQFGRESRTAGERCDSDAPGNADDPECRDVNSGSFHVILVNQVGLLDRAFVAEVSRGSQVWNQPVYGFDSLKLGETSDVYPGAAPGTVKIVSVRTRLRYIREHGPSWDAQPFDDHPGIGATMTLEYRLEIDAQGDIVGGEWDSEDHPDFLWTQSPGAFTGFFAELATIYEAATTR